MCKLAKTVSTTLLFACIGLSQSALAQSEEALQPLAQELFFGSTPFVQDPWEHQISVGFNYTAFDAGKAYEFSLGYEVGLTEKLTFGLEIPYAWLNFKDSQIGDVNGLGDAEASLLYSLVGRSDFLLAVGVATNIKTGDVDKGLGDERSNLSPVIAAAKQIGNSQWVASIGREKSDDDHVLNYSLSSSLPLANGVAILELAGTSSSDTDAAQSYLIPGFLWSFEKQMEFQVGLPVGLNSESDDWSLVTLWNISF